MTTAQTWFVKIPFSIYLGWISVATVANISQVLFFFDWGGWGLSPEVWGVVMLVVAGLLGAIMFLRERDLAYVLVLIWALVGIALKHSGTPVVSNTAWAAVMGLVLVVIVLGFRQITANRSG